MINRSKVDFDQLCYILSRTCGTGAFEVLLTVGRVSQSPL